MRRPGRILLQICVCEQLPQLKLYRGDVVVQILDGKSPPIQPPDGLVAGVDRGHTAEMKCLLRAALHERHQALALKGKEEETN